MVKEAGKLTYCIHLFIYSITAIVVVIVSTSLTHKLGYSPLYYILPTHSLCSIYIFNAFCVCVLNNAQGCIRFRWYKIRESKGVRK